jgi:hypothetical protein
MAELDLEDEIAFCVENLTLEHLRRSWRDKLKRAGADTPGRLCGCIGSAVEQGRSDMRSAPLA